MYIPNSFREDNLETLHQLIQHYNFATLITLQEGQPIGSHLPFLLDAKRGQYGTLIGHMARANSQWRTLDPQQEVLVIFQGPHTYISPSWYEVSPSVPTWNYAVVHAYGKIRLIEAGNFGELHTILKSLVDTHEAGFEQPWEMNLPEDYMHNLMRAITGFEIEITRLEGKFKLSQNRSENDQHRVIAAIKDSPDQLTAEVANLMEKR